MKRYTKIFEKECSKKITEGDSDKYRCTVCGWVYDPDKEGKPFSEQPDSYKCPECGAPKSKFEKM